MVPRNSLGQKDLPLCWLAFPSVEGLVESNAIGANVETVLSARLWLQRNNRRLESCFEWNSRCWNRVVMVRYKQRSMICSGSIRFDWCSYSFDNSILALKRGKSRYTARYFTFREFIQAFYLEARKFSLIDLLPDL